jgi:hypothetical protein
MDIPAGPVASDRPVPLSLFKRVAIWKLGPRRNIRWRPFHHIGEAFQNK